MDCDDVLLVLATREQRTLSGVETTHLYDHLADCDACRAMSEEHAERWRWVARVPDGALDGHGPVIPVVDPAVFDLGPELASGGMGRITRAFDRRLGREVAIKEVLDPLMRARFEREAAITARLQHPAIVPIYEAGTWPDGLAFYTMRLVDGGTLADAIGKASTMAARIALLPHVVAATEALAYAHSRRIIHRDLKPGNVLVGAFGETVVIDWGLAKELDVDDVEVAGSVEHSGRQLTRAGAVMGTPAFMPPEQASGDELDARADVYALGAILYNVLGGTPPYFDTHDHADRVLEVSLAEPPTPLATLAPEAPADLIAIVERAMARDKAARYPTAKEMAEELRRFEAGQLIASRDYRLRDLIARWIRRHRTAVAVGAVAIVALAAVGVIAFLNIARSRAAEQDARLAAERNTAALLEEQGRTELIAGDRQRALAYLAEAYRRGRDTPALHYLLAAATRDLAPLVAEIKPPQLTTYCGDDPNCAASDVDSLGFTADGRLVAIEDTGRISVWPGGRDGAPVKTIVLPDAARSGGEKAGLVAGELDPDATHAAVVRGGTLALWDVERGDQVWEVKDAFFDQSKLAFDPTGARLVVFSDDDDVHGLQLRDAHTGALLAALDIGDEHVEAVAFSADGGALVACGTQGGLRVWDTQTLQPTAAWQGTPGPRVVGFAGSDRIVVDGAAHRSVEIWRIADAKRMHTLANHHGPLVTIGTSADLIATSDDDAVRLWTHTGTLVAETREPRARMDHLVFVPGDILVAVGNDSQLYVWDTPTLARRAAFDAHDGAVDLVAIDRRATRIATTGLSDQRMKIWTMPASPRLARVPSRAAAFAAGGWLSAGDAATVLRDRDSGAELRAIPGTAVSNGRVQLSASRDGARVALLDVKTARVIDVATGNALAAFSTEGWPVLSADGRFIADTGDSDVRVREAGTGKVVLAKKFNKRVNVGTGALADDRLAIGVGPRIRQWRLSTGDELAAIDVPGDRNQLYDAVFDPAGTVLAVNGFVDKRVQVFDVATGRPVASLGDGHDLGSPLFNGDGRVLTWTERMVQLWDARTGAALTSIEGAGATYAFARDGARFATATKDGMIQLWDTATGRLLANLRGHRDAIVSLEFSADGARLVATGKDGFSTLWDVHLDSRDATAIGALAQTLAWKLEDGLVVARHGVTPPHDQPTQ